MGALRNEVTLSMEDENLAGNAQATAPENETATAQEGNESAPGEAQEQVSERNYTQEQVNEIVRSRLDRANKAIYDRYGVENEKGLDELIGMAQAYQTLKSDYDAMKDEVKGLREQNALRGNSVLPEREDDVRTYFKGKGLELSDEALKQALQSHPEWVAKATAPAPTTTVVPLGSQAEEAPKPNEEEEAAKMFGLSRFVS